MSAHFYADERVALWLSQKGYHPRSDAHGKAICDYFVDDLIYSSDLLQKAAKRGDIVFKLDYKVGQGSELEWKVDLVVGPPVIKPMAAPGGTRLAEGDPKEVWLALDAKTVMTEHGKARRNRQRDLNSFASIIKHHYPSSVVGGIIVVNLADKFKSPLRSQSTQHRNISKLVEGTVQLFREIPRAPKEGDGGIEATGVIIVKHTNIPGDKTILVTGLPAPQGGDPVHYKTFLTLMKETLEYRHFQASRP